jgi:hypothetical protein
MKKLLYKIKKYFINCNNFIDKLFFKKFTINTSFEINTELQHPKLIISNKFHKGDHVSYNIYKGPYEEWQVEDGYIVGIKYVEQPFTVAMSIHNFIDKHIVYGIFSKKDYKEYVSFLKGDEYSVPWNIIWIDETDIIKKI